MSISRDLTAVHVHVSRAERDLIKQQARRERVAVAQYIRDCINDRLTEEGERMPLLKIRASRHHRIPGAAR